MKAVFIERHGGPDVMKYGDLPDPVADRARSWSTSMRRASMAPTGRCGRLVNAQTQFPYVLGRDFSGVVSAVGEE